MNVETLKKLLKSDENPRLEFKLRYDFLSSNKTGLQDEIAKDVIALINTAGRYAEDFAYLILGASDKPNADGTRERESVKSSNYSRKTFLDIANARCYPPLPQLEYEEIELDGNWFGVIIVPPSKLVHVLIRDLNTDKDKLWRRNSVLVRHGDEVAVAGPDELGLMQQQKHQWSQQSTDPLRLRNSDEKTLRFQASDFLRKEIAFVDQECARTSDRTIASIFVGRRFEEWKPPLNAIEPSVEPPGRAGKPWSNVEDDLQLTGAAIVLGDPGTGKTVLMLNEVRRRCGTALSHLGDEHAPLGDLEFGVYFHANRLASRLANAANNATEVIVDLLSERHQIASQEFRLWLLDELERGRILLVIDSLDEVSQSSVRKLRENLSALARNASPCGMLFSARLVGYNTPPVPFVSHWELLRFTPNQLTSAISKWFHNDLDRVSYLKEMIIRTPPLEDLLLNPLFCMLACKVWEQAWGQRTSDLDYVPAFSNRCDLYQSFILQFRERWLQRLEVAGQILTVFEKGEFLLFAEKLAWHLWHRDPRSTSFTATELNQAIKDVSPPALVNRVDLLQDICESGMLTKLSAEDPETPYLFLHRTILEFLAASHLARNSEDPAHAMTATPNFQEYINNRNTRGILWMLAGRLKNPDILLKAIITWAGAEVEAIQGMAIDAPSPAIAQLLVDCLFECRRDKLSTNTRQTSWDLITRGLDRLQRRKRRKEWNELADLSLVYRVFYAVRKHEGGLSRSEQILHLLDDIRSNQRKLQKGRVFPPDALNDVSARLQMGYRSSCATIRWTSIWITGRLFDVDQATLAAELFDSLMDLIQSDDNPHVRSIACRALARLQHPQTFRILKEVFEGENLMIAAAAAIGLERLMTGEAINLLMAKAPSVLSDESKEPHNPLPVALVGALEGVVSVAQEYGYESLFHNEDLIKIFLRALEYPMPFTRASAASALGKMGWKPAWGDLRQLVELPDNGRPDVSMMRSSAAFACSRLCQVIDESEFNEAAKFFRQRLLDANEIPTVRRPSSGGLQVLARRGYFTKDLRNDLFQGAQDRDLRTALSCILALMRFTPSEVLEEVTIMIREFDRPNRKAVCGLVQNQPTRIGLMLILWILENDSHLDVLVGALFAVQESCDKAMGWRQYDAPDYIYDSGLLNSLVERCLILSQSETSVVVTSALGSIQQLCRLLLHRRKLDDLILEKVHAVTLVLLHSMDEKIQASACSLLGVIGDRTDIIVLVQLRDRTHSKKVRESANWASSRLSQRFS